MEQRKGLITMHGNPVTLLGKEVKVGEQAPDFTVLKDDLSPFTLADAKDKVKVISVVPSLDTGVCEAQTIKFNKAAAELGDVMILTMSVDLPFAQKRFCQANQIDQVLTLSDHKDVSFGLNYGFVIEELRLLSRGIVVLDSNNVVQYIEYVKEVTDHPDYEAAINAAKQILVK